MGHEKELTMRHLKIFTLLAVMLLAAIPVAADKKKSSSSEDQSLYIVSAKSGVVSIIDGEVTLKRGASAWEPILEGDQLKAGDVIKTGTTGRVEILLNPGTYLRIAENSEFAFPDLANFKLKLSLLKGTAILESSIVDVSIKFTTPQYMFSITQAGLYRFSATPEGRSEMMIRKGKVMVAGAQIKEGRKVVVENGPPSIVEFDKKAEDDFELWSKGRAQTIIASNKQLSTRRVKNSMTSGFYSNVWVYDPFLRCYTFLPGWGGFSSPYGFRYSNYNPYWNPYGYANGGWGSGSGSGWGSSGSGGFNNTPSTFSKGNTTATTTVTSPAPAPSTGSFGSRDRVSTKGRDN
jgi:hypothetical protein